jgi:hypothetical protein
VIKEQPQILDEVDLKYGNIKKDDTTKKEKGRKKEEKLHYEYIPLTGGGIPPGKGPLVIVKNKKPVYEGGVKKRTRCDCLGTVHVFVNNCIECGRITCIKEGAGPCFFLWRSCRL